MSWGQVFQGAGATAGGSLLDLGGSAFGAYLGRESQKDALQMQKKLLKKGPTWRMQGLERAGLNPLLAADMGSGQAPGMYSTTAPQFGASAQRNAAARQASAQTRLLSSADRKTKEEQKQLALQNHALLREINYWGKNPDHYAEMLKSQGAPKGFIELLVRQIWEHMNPEQIDDWIEESQGNEYKGSKAGAPPQSMRERLKRNRESIRSGARKP